MLPPPLLPAAPRLVVEMETATEMAMAMETETATAALALLPSVALTRPLTPSFLSTRTSPALRTEPSTMPT